MASKGKNGLYCVKMYLSEEQFQEWDLNRRESRLTESNYCRSMNHLAVKLRGAPFGNQNRKKGAANQKKEEKEQRRQKRFQEQLRKRYQALK